MLFAVGFDRSAGASIDDVYAGGVRNVLAALPSDIGRFIYISTTGVYGNAGGEWVDEDTPPDPQRDGGRASLAAEQALAEQSARDRAASSCGWPASTARGGFRSWTSCAPGNRFRR